MKCYGKPVGMLLRVGDEPVAEHVQKLRSLGGSDGNRIIRQAANRE
jgi:hypothetical protein